MLIKVVPNYRRPGVGRLPERAALGVVPAPSGLREVLEAATHTGVLVYPPLHPDESVTVQFTDSGAFLFTLSAGLAGGWLPVFQVRIGGSAGWGGLGNTDIVYIDPRADIDEAEARQIFSAMSTNIMPGTVGQFGFLAAHNFITPEGWDSLCLSTLNAARADGIPSLNCLVETDWYPQNTEFRFSFERGESITMTHDTPLGQVAFVPRWAVRLVDGTDGATPDSVAPSPPVSAVEPIDVTLIPDERRPGVGRRPTHDNRRAWLPQQARFCPVVEDVNRLGCLVYPPLNTGEVLQVSMWEDETIEVTLYASDESGGLTPVFTAEVGTGESGGLANAVLTVLDETAGYDEAAARRVLSAVVAEANLPPGSVGVRGAYRMVTPAWVDTVFTSIFNDLVRPIIPALTTRVETDRAASDTVFWHILQPGDGISIRGDAPVGQAFFVSREEVRSREATPLEAQRFVDRQSAYWSERAGKEKTTHYGATFTYHYRDHQKARRDRAAQMLGPLQDSD